MKHLLRRFGPIMGLAAVSQVLSAASTVVLPAIGLAEADLYAAATQVGLASVTGIVVGIVYNLAIGRPNYDHWFRWGAIAAAFSLIISTVQFLLLANGSFFDRVPVMTGLVVLLTFGVGGALLSVAGVAAVRLACLGKPRSLAAITVLPNAVLLATVLGVALAPFRNAFTSTAPAIGWAVGGLIMMVISVRLSRRTDANAKSADIDTHRTSQHTIALSIGAITSSVLPSIYIAAVAGLAVGLPYIVYLISKVGNSFVSLGVNSLLLVRYNWVEQRSSTIRVSIGFAWAAASLMTLSALSASHIGSEVAARGLFVAGWLMALIAGAVVIREMNALRLSRILLVKALIDLSAAGCAAVWLVAHPSFVGYFGCFAISQGITLAFGGRAARSRTLFYAGLVVLSAAVVGLLIGS